MLIPVITLTVPFIFAIIIIWIQSEERRKRHQLQADLYAKALDKGLPVPTDLFPQPKKRRHPHPLSVGAICIFIGAGITLALWLASIFATQIDGGEGPSMAFKLFSLTGIIPFMIGIAFVIIHFIEKTKRADVQ